VDHADLASGIESCLVATFRGQSRWLAGCVEFGAIAVRTRDGARGRGFGVIFGGARFGRVAACAMIFRCVRIGRFRIGRGPLWNLSRGRRCAAVSAGRRTLAGSG
jgi:hypothetical protein